MNRMIVSMFRSGMSPSQIDQELGLIKGTAHRVVVAYWIAEGAL